MHIFLNALGASSASGLTYLRNVLPQLAEREGIQTTVSVLPAIQAEFSQLRDISFVELPQFQGTARRFWFEQTQLPRVIQQVHADVLISAGNFAVRSSPVPQILLSGNSLYTSQDFYRDLLSRREYGLWLDTRLKAAFARRSVFWADCTVAPSRAFANQLRCWTGRPALAVHHGFDTGIFFSDETPLPAHIQSCLDSTKNDLKLLYVSHYNYFRNFETLFRALPLMAANLNGKRVRLFLTCRLENRQNPGSYRTDSALRLAERLGIREDLVELGAVPYRQLHQIYRACDLYVSPSYAETFAHPLVEAQACGLPIVASDLPVHREVCGDGALYFPRFSPEDLASRVLEAINSPNFGTRPAACFAQLSWGEHVEQLVMIAEELVRQRAAAYIRPSRIWTVQ
jgi:glycosyltransferase involved in cell wall biosynthesis